MALPLTHLGSMPVEQFLKEYWQKRPLLIRSGIENTEQLLTPEELAGLACESDIQSRLITYFDNKWELTHGPISEDTFLNLPNKNWTVLVQSVDTFVPEVAAILEYFTFLPRWRIDDVMVSYATPGGTVSAHYDFYDVFLIQGIGSRKWQLGGLCEPDTALVPDMPMKILEDFQPIDEWILYPGDILYIPPKLAHYGVALENCMTYSVGFRAPSKSQLFDLFATSAMSLVSDNIRYQDTQSTLNAGHFEINQETLENVRHSIIELTNNDDILLSVMAEIATGSAYGEHIHNELFEWQSKVKTGSVIIRSPLSRFSYFTGTPPYLFADGLKFPASIELARFVCQFKQIDTANLDFILTMEGGENLISELLNSNTLQFDEDWKSY